MAASSPVLRTHNLTKRYGRLLAVDRLDLEVGQGEVFGFLGPNGSGKTTTIGMILGLIRPTAGQVELFGRADPAGRRAALERVGSLVQGPAFYPFLSGELNLRVLGEIRGPVPRKRIEAVLELVGLRERARDRYSTYSLGMKQRLAIALALLREPQLVILDEPTNGLDPAGMAEVRQLLRRLGDQGISVFLSSHLLHEVEQVCHRVAVIQRGRLMGTVEVRELKAASRPRALRLRVERLPEPVDGPGTGAAAQLNRRTVAGSASLDGAGATAGSAGSPDPLVEAARLLERAGLAARVQREGDRLLLSGLSGSPAAITRLLAGQGLYVSELAPDRDSLESFFLELTAGDGAPTAGKGGPAQP